ncbi:MAG: hypothetical protein ACC654_07805, partial [Acidimicrobiia bacterium]
SSDIPGSGTGDGRRDPMPRSIQPGDPLSERSLVSAGAAVTGPSRALRRVGVVLIFGAALVLGACGGSASNDDTVTTQPVGPTITVAPTETPSTLDLGSPFTFQMPADTNTARFTFEVPAGGVVTMDASANAQNTGPLEIAIGTNAERLRRLQLLPGEASEPFGYVTSDEGGGSWAIEVQARPGDSVTLEVDAPLQADAGVAGDAGGNAGVAKPIDPGSRYDGLLGNQDGEDWYVIPLAGGDIVSVTLDAPVSERFGFGGVEPDLVYNGSPVATLGVDPGGEESVLQIFAQDQTGETYLRVSGSGPYGFTIEAGPQNDGGTVGDAGGDQGTAKSVDFGTIEGIIGDEDLVDFFALALPLDAVVVAELTAAPDLVGRARVEVLHNGNVLVATELGAGQTESWTYALVNAADESLYLRVAGAPGSYSASLTATTQPDGGGGGDAPDEQAAAKEVPAQSSFDGILNIARQYDNRDWYRFTAAETATINVSLAVDPTADSAIRLNIFGDALAVTLDVEPGGSGIAAVDVVAGATYTMQLGAGGQAAYTVTFG